MPDNCKPDVYRQKGYKDRYDYIESLADEYGV